VAGVLRVVLDGANIGWSFGRTSFSAAGLVIALRFFESIKVDTVTFLPASYVTKRPSDGSRGNSLMETEDVEILTALVDAGRLTMVPPGNDDDLFILSFGRLLLN
jgi:hypothetical protein